MAKKVAKPIVKFNLLALIVMIVASFFAVWLVGNKQLTTSEAAEFARTLNIIARPSQTTPGGKVNTIWFSINAIPQGWIGLYRVDSPDRSYLSRKYLSECTGGESSSTKSGSCEFIMPQAGVYEFRLFKGIVRAGTSNKVLVSQVNVSTTPSVTPTITRYPTLVPSVSPYPSPRITCYPPPPCLYMEPRCLIPEMPDWCPDF